MTYNFDTLIDRRNSDSYKWDSPDSGRVRYPLWVADMDWRAAEPIIEAVRLRVEHGVFGYVTTPMRLREAVSRWFLRRHGWNFAPERISTAPGVVPALVAVLRELGGRVLMNTPAYNCFFDVIRDAGCELLTSPLRNDNHYFRMDWDDMERQMEQADIYLLCNPHNPTGRVWTHEELARIADMAQRHQVLVLSDEIHCEFAWHDGYTPYATVAAEQEYIIFTAATKAFNIAGLQLASIISSSETMQQIVDNALAHAHIEDLNPFGVVATEAAYNLCEDWLEQMNRYVEANYQYLCNFYTKHFPQYPVTRMDGTYLVWVDYRAMKKTTEAFCAELAEKASVKFNAGEIYGGAGFIRINIACPRCTLQAALDKLLEQDYTHPIAE